MEPEVLTTNVKSSKRNTLMVVLSAIILLMLFAAITFAYMTLQNDAVYKGVHIGGTDVSGLSLDKLRQVVENQYMPLTEDLSITLKTNKLERKATYKDLNIRYDTEAAVNEAYNTGREGNIFKRLYDIARAGISGVYINVPIVIDESSVENFVNGFYNDTLVPVQEGSVLITDNNIKIRSGIHGEHIDKDKATEQVKSVIGKQESGVVELDVIVTPPSKLNVDEIYNQVNSKASDAFYKMENSSLVLVPHKLGYKAEKAVIEKIVAELEATENTEKEIPITVELPAVTSEMAKTMLFRDVLGSASSSFSTGTQNGRNRGHNIALAASKINNMILMPGEEFSFNKVVGPRDLEHGFKIAYVYSAGKIIDGVGGGICQVSSTMYNAVLKADLKVTERRNHSFVVGYVPLGQDATAYYGGVDFRFLNSTNWPMKLIATVKGNTITCTILGTNETPEKTVIISNKILKETPYTVKYTDDPTLPVGTMKEKQEGLNGYVVETYKTIKIGDKVVSQEKLHTSTYKAYAQEILRGTKPVENAPAVSGSNAQNNQGSAGTSELVKETDPSANPDENSASSDSISEEILDEAPPEDSDI